MLEKLRVLVTEDDRITLELYNSFLPEEIFERFFAQNGKEALDAYRTWQPEMIILDLMLPVVSGYNVLKEIREDLKDKKIPILISSKLSSKDDILSCAKFGVQGYLPKPINWKEIGLKVLDCFQKAYPQMVDRMAGLRKHLEARTASKAREQGREKGTGSAKEAEKMEAERAEFQTRGSAGDSLPSPKELAGSPVFTTAEEFIQKRFSHVDLSHPFLTELFRICTHRQAPQLALQKLSGSNQSVAGLENPPGVNIKSPSSAGVQKKDINYIVDGLTSLASLPRIIFEIDRVINDPRSSASLVADVISKDPNITMKILKIVNSAFYNFTSKIDTISRAVAILGSEELRTLAMGTSILEMFKGIPEDLVNMKSFWEHSVACGTAARLIGSHMKIAETERLFVGGLLHDIGRLIVYKHLPQQGREMLFRAKRDGSLLHTVELEFLGFDHSQIGAALMQKWKLPATLEQTIGYHHEPTRSQYALETSIVHIADILANALMIGTSGEWFVPPVSPEAWTKLGLPASIFSDSVQLIDQQVAEFVHIFLGEL